MTNNYTNNKLISASAKGVMSYLLNKPDTYNLTIQDITDNFKESKTIISHVIQELISTGYIVRVKGKSDKGRFTYTYNIIKEHDMI